jgi:hypothetical protein
MAEPFVRTAQDSYAIPNQSGQAIAKEMQQTHRLPAVPAEQHQCAAETVAEL